MAPTTLRLHSNRPDKLIFVINILPSLNFDLWSSLTCQGIKVKAWHCLYHHTHTHSMESDEDDSPYELLEHPECSSYWPWQSVWVCSDAPPYTHWRATPSTDTALCTTSCHFLSRRDSCHGNRPQKGKCGSCDHITLEKCTDHAGDTA